MTFEEAVALAREVKTNKTRSHVQQVTRERDLTRALVKEIDLMLAGGEEAIRLSEQCTECGHGGEGPTKDVLKQIRSVLDA